MPVKESSDELNAPVLTTAFIAPAGRVRTARDYVALAVATCGVGFLPVAPGTWGSAVGVAIYVALREASARLFASAEASGLALPPLEAFRTAFGLVGLMAVTVVGIWAATRTESLLGRKDPGVVVVDEVAGQLITFLFVPFHVGGAWTLVTGFLAFRLFDIWKPYPIRRLESLESGLGIMADDVLAGAYAATLMSLLAAVYLMF
ncbi:MAG TPA: phosphatidylglycerophosphatase A [Pyrinomonadaceae bacterium]|nr:phosphatidylglycerophosphatase A [Pyrinomonadaceae bacterium]